MKYAIVNGFRVNCVHIYERLSPTEVLHNLTFDNSHLTLNEVRQFIIQNEYLNSPLHLYNEKYLIQDPLDKNHWRWKVVFRKKNEFTKEEKAKQFCPPLRLPATPPPVRTV